MFPKYLTAFGMSLIPIIELRGSMIYAAAQNLNPIVAYLLSVIGNMIPVPFIILFIRPIFDWMKKRSAFLKRVAEKMEEKAEKKSDVIRKYEMLGLFILVAIPLPGTGAWTGSLVAAMFGMRLKYAWPMILLGVMTAGLIVALGAYGVVGIIF